VGSDGIASGDGVLRFDVHDERLVVGARAMLDSGRDDEHLAGLQLNIAGTKLHRHTTGKNQEDVVRLGV
jgi:hypothetical protein